MDEDLTPKLRKVYPAMPAEHMRIIGEICVYWTSLEAGVLQAICETAQLDKRAGFYLGTNVPVGTRFDMLTAIASVLKENPRNKQQGIVLLKVLKPVRSAYLLRNKYAHGHLRTRGPDKDPEMNVRRSTKRLELQAKPLTLAELKADADTIFEAGEALLTFLQSHGFCKQAWF
jgi:hypothetical protein